MCKVLSLCHVIETAKKSLCKFLLTFFLIPPQGHSSQNACRGCPLAPTPAWMVVTVLGSATTRAPVRMASISLDLNVSVEGAHAMSTGKMLHIRIVRGTKEVQIWVMSGS